MKKLLLLIITLTSIGTKAQMLVDTNKVWNVVECSNFGGCGTAVFHFDGDTTIGINQYKLLTLNFDSGGGFFNYPFAAREDTSNKQVFFYYGNSEYLAYDFSLNQGDTFTTNINGCGFQMTVDSVDTVTLLNGESRKRMFLSNISQEIWIEGVGSLYGLTNVGVYSCSFDLNPELICFKENDTLKYLSPNYTNCFFNTLGISELSSQNNFKIKPNPFSEFTTLTFESPLHERNTLIILNTHGQTVMEYQNIQGNEIKIEKDKMNSGIYFFQLLYDRRIIANGKLVLQ